MSSQAHEGRYLTAITEPGIVIIHASSITLSWVPRDVVNDAYNLGGMVTVGTFDTVDEAKEAATEKYSIGPDSWEVCDSLPFDSDPQTGTEDHVPEIDGHHVIRHGIRWK
jgi:hypothetical protein